MVTVKKAGFWDQANEFEDQFVPEPIEILVVNGTGSDRSRGDGARLNTQFSDGTTEFLTTLDGAHGSQEVWGTIRNQTVGIQNSLAIGVICAEDIPSGGVGKAYLQGIVDANIAGALAAGSRLHIDGVSGAITSTLAAGDKCHAILIETAGSAGIFKVYLDGIGTLGPEV